jgi:hypothetical protein
LDPEPFDAEDPPQTVGSGYPAHAPTLTCVTHCWES